MDSLKAKKIFERIVFNLAFSFINIVVFYYLLNYVTVYLNLGLSLAICIYVLCFLVFVQFKYFIKD